MLDLNALTEKIYLAEQKRLQDIKHRRQPLPKNDILRLLGEYGFTYSSNGGSHMPVRQEAFGVFGGIVADSGKLSPHYNAAKYCLTVLEAAWQKRKAVSQPVSETSKASARPFVDVLDNPPPGYDLLAGEEADTVILRHKIRPCIGSILPRHMTASALADITLQLDKEVCELEAQIERAIDMEFTIDDDGGTLTLANPSADARFYYSPFTGADDQEHAVTCLTEALDKEEEGDKLLRKALDNLDKRHDLRDRNESIDPATGQTKISYRYINPLTLRSSPVELFLSPKGKPSYEGVYTFLDQLWHAYWNGIQGTLKTYGGFKTKTVKGPDRTTNLEATHPIFSQTNFTIKNFPALNRTIENVIAEGLAEQDIDIMAVLYLEMASHRDHAMATINKAMGEVRALASRPSHRIYEVFKDLLSKGVSMQCAHGRAETRGEFVRVYLNHPSIPGNNSFSCLNITVAGSNDHISLVDEKDIGKLEGLARSLPELPPRHIFHFAMANGPQGIADRIAAGIAADMDRRQAKASLSDLSL